jgi:hypothetical protein
MFTGFVADFRDSRRRVHAAVAEAVAASVLPAALFTTSARVTTMLWERRSSPRCALSSAGTLNACCT